MLKTQTKTNPHRGKCIRLARKAFKKCKKHKQTWKRERRCENSLRSCNWRKQISAGEGSYNFATVEACISIHISQPSRVPPAQYCYFIFYTGHLTSTGLPSLLFMYKNSVYKRLLCLNSALESRQRNVSRLLHVKPVSANGFTSRTQSSKKECAEISLHTSVPEL